MSSTDNRPPGEKRTILIVEDSKTQAAILRHLLTTAGYEVRVALNGKEALNEVEKEKPVIILTDIIMPEMNGYELCRALKDEPDTADIPVILVTQLFDPGDVIQGLACGADNFIIKPYEEEYLLERVREILQTHYKVSDDTGQGDIQIHFAGKEHLISSNRQQILNILLSTYEIAIRKNNELLEAKDRIVAVNDQLSEANDELVKINDDLINEIAERKRVEKALSLANQKLSLLSSITRHDMKNTMMALLSYNELGVMDGAEGPYKIYLDRERNLLNRLCAQIEFTRLYEELGVKGAVWTNVADLIVRISRGFTQFTTEINDELQSYEIFADPLIEKVFYNLFDNAYRHGEHVSRILVTSKVSDEALQVFIRDDGAGVSEEDKEKIFGRGYGKNTGLGLFLVREILSITGITVKEQGTQRKGACFVLTIPTVHYRKIK